MRIFLSKKFHSVTVRVFTGKFKCQISLIVRLFPSIVSMTIEDFSTYIRKWHKKNLKKKKNPEILIVFYFFTCLRTLLPRSNSGGVAIPVFDVIGIKLRE